jgi:hypothetical protein
LRYLQAVLSDLPRKSGWQIAEHAREDRLYGMQRLLAAAVWDQDACHDELRRWLAQAQLRLHYHPGDGRKKGVSDEHVQALAHLHQRRLAPLPQASSASVPVEPPPLPIALLALPETVSALQAQIAALQQQVAALTHLLQQQAPSPISPATPAQPSRMSQRPATPAADRARPAAFPAVTTPRQPTHVIARVEYGEDGRYVVIYPRRGLLPLEPDTPEWFRWLAQQDSFRFVGKGGHFTVHHWWRVPRGAWRAHRHIRNHSYNLRPAPTQELTIVVFVTNNMSVTKVIPRPTYFVMVTIPFPPTICKGLPCRWEFVMKGMK